MKDTHGVVFWTCRVPAAMGLVGMCVTYDNVFVRGERVGDRLFVDVHVDERDTTELNAELATMDGCARDPDSARIWAELVSTGMCRKEELLLHPTGDNRATQRAVRALLAAARHTPTPPPYAMPEDRAADLAAALGMTQEEFGKRPFTMY